MNPYLDRLAPLAWTVASAPRCADGPACVRERSLCTAPKCASEPLGPWQADLLNEGEE